MSKTIHSKKWYDSARPQAIREDRERLKKLKRLRKTQRRNLRRQLIAAEKYGKDVTHGPCLRKKRYATRHAALMQAERSERQQGVPQLSVYKCQFCGGWHLTSHPILAREDTDGGDGLTILEIFEAARDAAIRIRKIEEQTAIKRERVGVQGHGYEVHAKSGILDPMRKVDDLLDWQAAQLSDSELAEPIEEALEVVRGIEKLGDDLAVELVVRHYLQAESWESIVRGDDGSPRMSERIEAFGGLPVSTQVRYLKEAFRQVLPDWERIGIARLKQMGEEA